MPSAANSPNPSSSPTSSRDAVVLAIDAGTTGVRAFAVDNDGAPCGWTYREFGQIFPQPGWVEHDPVEIWEAVQAVISELASSLQRPIAAIGITNQRETIVAWDAATGLPRHNAIVWQDRRTADRCDRLQAEGVLPAVRSTTGLVLDPYFSGSKIEWLLTAGGVTSDDNLRLGTIDTWLIWKMTDGRVHVTDPTNAARTMLFDIRTLEWSAEMCEIFGVPLHALPAIGDSSGRLGITAPSCAAGAGIPISGVAGDQQASLFGQACFETGMTKNTYGTGSFVLMNVGDSCPEPVDGLLNTIAWTLDRPEGRQIAYALEGAIFVTGAAVQWLRDGLGFIEHASEMGPLAGSVPDSDGVVMVPAFVGLGSPFWDPRARGAVFGLSRGTTKAHIARAVVDSMAFQTRDVVDAMCAATSTTLTELRVDGGAAQMDLLIDLVGRQLDVRIRRSAVSETTALGAAYLAGLAEGVWPSREMVSDKWRSSYDWEPEADPDPASTARAYELWQRGVERSRDWA
jgi:glycerol kinase